MSLSLSLASPASNPSARGGQDDGFKVELNLGPKWQLHRAKTRRISLLYVSKIGLQANVIVSKSAWSLESRQAQESEPSAAQKIDHTGDQYSSFRPSNKFRARLRPKANQLIKFVRENRVFLAKCRNSRIE